MLAAVLGYILVIRSEKVFVHEICVAGAGDGRKKSPFVEGRPLRSLLRAAKTAEGGKTVTCSASGGRERRRARSGKRGEKDETGR